MRLFLLFFVLFALPLSADGIRLLNDSNIELIATIRGNTGKFLGQMTVAPGVALDWVQGEDRGDYTALRPMNPYTEGYSQTPYTVVWTTKGGEVYSICRYKSPGSTVAATQCDQMVYPGKVETQPPPEEKKK